MESRRAFHTLYSSRELTNDIGRILRRGIGFVETIEELPQRFQIVNLVLRLVDSVSNAKRNARQLNKIKYFYDVKTDRR